MTWNIAPECISAVFLCIIWVYSRKGNLIPDVKNKLFQVSMVTTFCAIITNILSTVLIYNLSQNTIFITWVVTLIYFIATPLMGLVYFLYAFANIYDDTPKLRRYFLISSIPGAIYLVLALLTPFTKNIFNITLDGGYVQGDYIAMTYIIFYFYCSACVILVVFQGKKVDPIIRRILFTFPVIAAVVIVIQFFQPDLILSGSAATSAILIIYLYLQNRQVSIDYLTHLPHRHQFLKMVDIFLGRGRAFSIAVISLREFKSINDVHGQQSGDYLLAALSKFLRSEIGLREGEIYRYSGDEFALLINSGDENVLRPIIDKVLERMALAWEVQGCICLLNASIGIVSYPETSDDIAGLINGLEYAVTYAKTDSTNYNVCYCTPELLKKSKRRHVIAEELEENLNSKGFEIHYQPIYSVESEQFIKAEALLRMPSERLERVFPDEFIPVAEETGLIIEITYLVLDKVCKFINKLKSEGIDLDNINVNFSALQFSQKDILLRIIEIMDSNEIPYSKIKVEITESALVEDSDTITACLHQMNEIGMGIGLDDFGTGYSNLISALDLPLDTVKLDKSLIWSAVKDERYSIAVQNFARAFRELNLTVLAEGVETEEQRKFVVDAGCTLIQGFLYAKPMPENEFISFMKKNPHKSLK